MKYLRALAALAVFLAIYLAVYTIHVRYFRVDVVLYSAIFDGVLAAAISAVLLRYASYFDLFSPFEKTLLVSLWLLTAYSIAITGPAVLDRSLSFYLLEKLDQRGGGIQLARFEELFTTEYVVEHRLVDVRLTEQQESGTIVIENGCVKLTPWGKKLTRFSRFFRKHFLPKHRLLMGEYSDDLTDPFRNSDGSTPNYTCD